MSLLNSVYNIVSVKIPFTLFNDSKVVSFSKCILILKSVYNIVAVEIMLTTLALLTYC